MKSIYRKTLPFVFLLFVATLALYGCKRAPASIENSTKAKAVYYCPMHPSFISDKPGDCSICGMKLVKKEADAQETKTSISEPSSPGLIVTQTAQEKEAGEVCAEHNCTMNNCAMKVKTHLKPGEKIVCPVCGIVVTLQDGKVIEIPAQSSTQSVKTQDIKKEHKIIYYRNPMNPQVTSPVPAKDQMGMDYVPVYEDEQAAQQSVPGGAAQLAQQGTPRGESVPGGAESQTGVKISQEKQQLIGVKIEPVKKIDLTKVIRASGKIAYDPELAVAQEEFVQALINADSAKDSPLQDVIDRAKSLVMASRNKLALMGMSTEQIGQLEKNKKTDTSLYLPGKGESVWAYVSIYEYEIGFVKVGAKVDIEAVAYPGQVFSGTIASINPVLDAQTRTNQIRVQVENPESKLKPEMFVNASIKIDIGEKLAVPDTAVLDTGLRKIVYVSKQGNIMESREVTLGQKVEGYYEVIEGLQEGEFVVTSGNFLVDSESKLKATVQ